MKRVKKLNGSDLLEILILAKDLIYKHKEDMNWSKKILIMLVDI